MQSAMQKNKLMLITFNSLFLGIKTLIIKKRLFINKKSFFTNYKK